MPRGAAGVVVGIVNVHAMNSTAIPVDKLNCQADGPCSLLSAELIAPGYHGYTYRQPLRTPRQSFGLDIYRTTPKLQPGYLPHTDVGPCHSHTGKSPFAP